MIMLEYYIFYCPPVDNGLCLLVERWAQSLAKKRPTRDVDKHFTDQGVSRHFGPRTLRTQDISAPSDWCRSVRTVRH